MNCIKTNKEIQQNSKEGGECFRQKDGGNCKLHVWFEGQDPKSGDCFEEIKE